MKLENRVAIITGGGTGIGRAISILFGQQGARVVVNYSKSKDAADETVAEIAKHGSQAISVAADVARESDVKAMIDRTVQEFGRIDILVNNAGWSTRIPHDKLELLTDEIWDRTMNTNLRGMFYCVRAAAPHLRQQTGANIINIASVAGIMGVGSSMAYAASKAGMIIMTKSLARALAPAIRVNAIAPGLVQTGFAGWPDAACEAAAQVAPLKRIATSEELANAALYLAAEANSTTGETMIIDSGNSSLGSIQNYQRMERM